MASPQKENGFTAICNELMDVLSKAKLNGTQFKIVNCILRYTYGFQRKEHEFSLSFLSEATNTHKIQIKRELTDLINNNVITVVKEAGFTSSRVLSLNKNYETWLNVLDSIQGANSLTVNEKANSQGTKKLTLQGANSLTKKENIKENIKENVYSTEFETFYSLYPNPFNKSQTFKNWNKLLKSETVENIMRATNNYISYIKARKIDEQYIVRSTNFIGLKEEYKAYLETPKQAKERTGVKPDNTKLIRRDDF